VTVSRGRLGVAIKAIKRTSRESRVYKTRHHIKTIASSSAEAGSGDGLLRPAVPEPEGRKEVEEAMNRVKQALNQAESVVSRIESLPSARLPTRVRVAWHDPIDILRAFLLPAKTFMFVSQCRWIRFLSGPKQCSKC
jgi:hypothetical protein